MIKKIDINSLSFQNELENTKEFTKDVLKKYNFVFNPMMKLIYLYKWD